MRSESGFLRGLSIVVSAFFCMLLVLGISAGAVALGETTSTVYFSDDFENGLQNWTHAYDSCVVVSTDFRSGSHSILCNDQNSDIQLSLPVDLSGAVAPVLTFWQRATQPDPQASSYLVKISASVHRGDASTPSKDLQGRGT